MLRIKPKNVSEKIGLFEVLLLKYFSKRQPLRFDLACEHCLHPNWICIMSLSSVSYTENIPNPIPQSTHQF